MMQAFLKFLLAVTLSLAGLLAHAQVDADPLPGDPKLVVFQYDENNSYRVYTKPLAGTHIQLDTDERVKVLALGETTGWITAQKDNNVFIKPRYPNINTSGTLITTKRTYQFTFRSTTESGRWYQRVTFVNSNDMLIEGSDSDRLQLAAAVKEKPLETSGGRNNQSFAPELLNFNYEVTGDISIRPTTIYDDGSSTYIQVRSVEDVPAVFRLLDKEIELVDYTLRNNNTIVIPRILDSGLLKLGNHQAQFHNLTRVRKGFLGTYSVMGAGQ